MSMMKNLTKAMAAYGEMLNKIGGARLTSLRNAPHLGYSITHLK